MFRYEKKYVISERSKVLLANTLKSIMNTDVNEEGQYLVRSLYFDTKDNTSYNDVLLDKYDRRKYRIRCYDLNDEQIYLEEKRKISDRIYKTRSLITRSEFEQIILGKVDFLKERDEVSKRFYFAYRVDLLRPNLIIEYERTAFNTYHSDLRITFDRNIKVYSNNVGLFQKSDNWMYTRKDDPVVMEVKYHNFIPSMIPIVLSKVKVVNSNFSKYALSFEKLFVRSSWR